MELPDVDSDFSIDMDELNVLEANRATLKASSLNQCILPTGSNGRESNLVQNRSSSAQPSPKSRPAPNSLALDLEDVEFSDEFSDDCFIVDDGGKSEPHASGNSAALEKSKLNPSLQSIGTGGQIPSTSHQKSFQFPKPPPPNPTTTKQTPVVNLDPDVINCDAFFDDLDDEALGLININIPPPQTATSNHLNRTNSFPTGLGSSPHFPRTNSVTSTLAKSRESSTSNLPTKAQPVQRTLLNFGYATSRPPADPASSAGAGQPQRDYGPSGVLKRGINYAGHYTPPRNCYELHHDYVPLLHCPLAVETWIYPTNYPVRDYQFNIVQKALHENTLVSLPTGLGKTFIAAVVMYNFYRWFPKMKVVFTAPTKPLVAQQIEACYNICGITQNDSVELTGAQSQASRVSSWETKRVFYLTPQVMENDLKSGLVHARDVACIVIDEAHRAQKAYAYVNVVQALYKKNPLVRVLALSATPGTTMQNVQSVVTNLNIARIEFRTEDALDIRPYTFDKAVDKVIVPPGPDIEEMATGMKRLISPFLEKLNSRGGYWSKDPDKANAYQLLEARNSFRARTSGQNSWESNAAEGEYAVCISLLRILDLLVRYGFTTFYTKLREWLSESGPGAPKYRQQLAKHPMFIELLRKTELIVNSPDYHLNFKSHPKVGHLYQYLKRHFELQESVALGGRQQTKVMIFAQFRETVEEVIAVLAPLSPAVRPMAFIGQASGKSGKGLRQKEQIEVISKFKRGGYNVLVCTSIGEEGLDIGEVDLIVCYDSSNSPIRMLQRMGRTGRRRKGRVCMLLTQGKEERSFGNSKSTHKAVLKGIKEGVIAYYSLNPRMLPEGCNPTCVKKHIDISPYQAMSAKTKGASSRKSTPHGLTPDELDHFHEMYGAAIPIVPSLTRYPVHQCHPGFTHRVRHSTRTTTFVEMMRMCDSAINNCDESLVDTSNLLQTSVNSDLPPPKTPPANDMLDFLEGISLSSISDDEIFVLPSPPAPPSKIQWSDLDSRFALICNRHAALAKRSLETESDKLNSTPISPPQSNSSNNEPPNPSASCNPKPDTLSPNIDFSILPHPVLDTQPSIQSTWHQPSREPIVNFETKTIPFKPRPTAPQPTSVSNTLDINCFDLDDSIAAEREPSTTQTPIQLNRRRPRQGAIILSPSPSPQRSHKRRRLRVDLENIMELEAEESDAGGSSEDESSSGDDADDSFVCGDSEVVQECEAHESGMQDIYRQSLLSQNNIADCFSTRPNQFGRQKSNLRYVVSKKKPVANDSQAQDDSFVVDDDEPMESEEWTDEQESETMDEDQANARLESILDIPDEQATAASPSPILSQSYAEAALSASHPPPLPQHWQRYKR